MSCGPGGGKGCLRAGQTRPYTQIVIDRLQIRSGCGEPGSGWSCRRILEVCTESRGGEFGGGGAPAGEDAQGMSPVVAGMFGVAEGVVDAGDAVVGAGLLGGLAEHSAPPAGCLGDPTEPGLPQGGADPVRQRQHQARSNKVRYHHKGSLVRTIHSDRVDTENALRVMSAQESGGTRVERLRNSPMLLLQPARTGHPGASPFG